VLCSLREAAKRSTLKRERDENQENYLFGKKRVTGEKKKKKEKDGDKKETSRGFGAGKITQLIGKKRASQCSKACPSTTSGRGGIAKSKKKTHREGGIYAL